jgi:hypothetical protein
MAEEEKIREHAKHALQALTNKTKNWKDRIKDFLWEVFIILVAVNITLWFHNWNEKRHESAQVKEFLIDIRENLVQDTTNIRNYIKYTTDKQLAYYDSVLSQINRNKIDIQYIDSKYGYLINSSFNMNFNYGIYQSFNSANNLRLINNRKLVSDIISLYSNFLPAIQSNYKYMQDLRMSYFEKYIALKIGFDNKNLTKLSTIIYQPEVLYTFKIGSTFLKEINRQGENINNQITTIIQEIDQELKTQYNYKGKTDNVLP